MNLNTHSQHNVKVVIQRKNIVGPLFILVVSCHVVNTVTYLQGAADGTGNIKDAAVKKNI